MKKRNAWIAGVLMILVLCLPMAALGAIPEPSADFYVADFANVIDDDVQAEMVNKGLALNQKNGAQLVLVTVPFTDGVDVADYTNELFNQWQIGDAALNNGVLIVMVTGQGDCWALQGEGIENTITSGMLGDILDEYMYDDFDAGDYTKAAQNTYNALLSLMEQLPGTSNQGNSNANANATGQARATSRYISDPLGILSDKTINYINDTNVGRGAEGSRLYVGIVDYASLGNYTPQDVAEDYYAEQNLKDNDMMAILVIANNGEYDNYYVQAGPQLLDSVLSEQVMGDTLDKYLEPDFAKQKYDEGMYSLAQRLFSMTRNSNLIAGYGTDYYDNDYYGGGYTQPRESSARGGSNGMWLLIILVIILLIVFSNRGRNRRVYGVPYNPYAGWRVRRYGSGGFWGGFFTGMFMPRARRRGYVPPPPPPGARPRTPGGPNRPGGSGGSGRSSSPGGAGRKPPSGGSGFGSGTSSGGGFGSFFGGGGSSRGGGAGRSSGGSSFGGSGRSGGGFGGGRSSGGGAGRSSGGGGSSRGGGAGRRR